MGGPEILKSVFGFDDFRPGQAEVVDAVAQGNDVLAIMPTGGGKSLCFQLPALMRDGVTLVISPLIALMRDQVRALRESGVEAGCLTSGNTDEEIEEVFCALDEGRLKLLYIAPERLASSGAANLLNRIGVNFIAVDEAHCVSQWGHDFRPDYLRIGALRKSLGVPIAAFTATADEETRVEIVDRLFGGDQPSIFLRGFDRPNISLAFQPKDNPRRQIVAFAAARKGQSGIVYCATRAKTETLAKALADEGHSTAFYHGGMDADDRRWVETRFQREDGLIVTATVAFGMGIDKPDIRWVAHADLPKSIEAYYQEIGRAGRDGDPAETLTLYGADDIRLRRTQIDEGLAPPERRTADHGRMNALLGLAESLGCRRKVLLSYFGETSEACQNCDVCLQAPETFDGTVAVQKALSAVLRTGENFGVGYLTDVLRGERTDRIVQNRHDQLPTFGVGSELSKPEWAAVFLQMLGRDHLRPDPERRGGLRMTSQARMYLSGDQKITLRKFEKLKGRTPTAKALVADEDAPLLSALKAHRRGLAEEARVPAYVIFNDRTLIEMAQTRPIDLDGMAGINGVGAKKLEKFGASFLKVITGEATEETHPQRRKLAGRPAGLLFDRLLETQADLHRGPGGIDKPMRCTSSDLAKVAAQRPANLSGMSRILGDRHAERFGEAFLAVLQEE